MTMECKAISCSNSSFCIFTILELDESISTLHHDIENWAILSIEVTNITIINVMTNTTNINLNWG